MKMKYKKNYCNSNNSPFLFLLQMVFLGRNKRFGGRRVGQEQMGNGMMGNGMLTEFVQTEPADGVPNIIADSVARTIPDSETIQQAEEDLGLQIDAARGDNGESILSVSQRTDDGSQGPSVVISVPEAAPAPQGQDVCEFPVQSVNLIRDVLITNTAPQVVDVQTDICGNVVSYTESMTRTMNATEWRATNPAQLAGPVLPLTVNGQGAIRGSQGNFNNVVVANSPGVAGINVPYNVVRNDRVGGRRAVHMSNRNAQYGAAQLGRWRGA